MEPPIPDSPYLAILDEHAENLVASGLVDTRIIDAFFEGTLTLPGFSIWRILLQEFFFIKPAIIYLFCQVAFLFYNPNPAAESKEARRIRKILLHSHQ